MRSESPDVQCPSTQCVGCVLQPICSARYAACSYGSGDLASPAPNNQLPWYYSNNNGSGQPNEVNNPNALSPCVLEKWISVGDYSIGNLLKFHDKITIPGWLSPSVIDRRHFVTYLDKIRFQRAYFFNPVTGELSENTAASGISPTSVICTDWSAQRSRLECTPHKHRLRTIS